MRTRLILSLVTISSSLAFTSQAFAGSLAVGANAACASPGNDLLVCWGGAGSWLGERFEGGRSPSAGGAFGPASVPFRTESNTLGVSIDTACGITPKGRVLCVGLDLNDPSSGLGSTSPAELKGVKQPKAIAFGELYGCAISKRRSVACFGKGADRSLRPVRGLAKVTKLSLSSTHGCAVMGTGQVKCFGANSGQSIAPGSVTSYESGKLVPGVHATAVAVSSGASCAIEAAGAVRCWGKYTAGSTTRPATIKGLPALKSIAGPSSAGNHFCGVTGAGAVYCWGAREEGALGISSGVDAPPATPDNDPHVTVKYAGAAVHVSGLPRIAEVATGPSASCARTADGDIWCWGDPAIASVGATSWPKKKKGRLDDAAPRLVYSN